jgi:purine nucleosidase
MQSKCCRPLRVVLDTDAFNEVDDQFTIAYALKSSEALELEAIYAAPFHNARSNGPAEGMEKSYHEILRVADLAGTGVGAVHRGAASWMSGPQEAVASDATEDLIRRAHEATAREPLHVVGIAAATNIASAILLDPRIRERIHVTWLGGQPLYWPTADEFNLRQDMHAVRVLLESGVRLTLVPCKNVAENLRVTAAELEASLPAMDRLCQFLRERFDRYLREKGFASKPLWDVAAMARLVNPAWVTVDQVESPTLSDDKRWISLDCPRHRIEVASGIDRDAIFTDLCRKLSRA